MSFELINLTLPTVLREIGEVLDDYPEHPYQSAFSMPEFRQKLIAHVLNQVPNHYAIAGETVPVRKLGAPHRSALAERMNRETVIRGGILHIMRENADRLNHMFQQQRAYSLVLAPLHAGSISFGVSKAFLKVLL